MDLIGPPMAVKSQEKRNCVQTCGESITTSSSLPSACRKFSLRGTEHHRPSGKHIVSIGSSFVLPCLFFPISSPISTISANEEKYDDFPVLLPDVSRGPAQALHRGGSYTSCTIIHERAHRRAASRESRASSITNGNQLLRIQPNTEGACAPIRNLSRESKQKNR